MFDTNTHETNPNQPWLSNEDKIGNETNKTDIPIKRKRKPRTIKKKPIPESLLILEMEISSLQEVAMLFIQMKETLPVVLIKQRSLLKGNVGCVSLCNLIHPLVS